MTKPGHAGKISATFLDFSERTDFHDRMLDRGLDFWRTELRDLHEAGMEDVVIARTVLAGRAHYHSAVLEEWSEQDDVAAVMQAAAEVGVGVYLGLFLNIAFWDRNRDFVRMMRRDLALNRLILGELLAAYRGHPALRGIYVTHEPDRENVETPERANALQVFLGDMYRLVKDSCGLPVFCSPFFSKRLPPEELAAWWAGFLDRPMFDILAMQDGVGCAAKRGIEPEDIPPIYRALAPVFAAKKIQFWNNVETFTITGPGQQLQLGPLDRIARQYEAGQAFVERTITWEYGHFLGRQQAGSARYEAFRKWNHNPKA
jgi:hypothetical protein